MEWVKWLNENWLAVAGPVLIVVVFWVGGLWIRKALYDPPSSWLKRVRWKGKYLVIETTRTPFLQWFVLLGCDIATQVSLLPYSSKAIASQVIISLFILSLVWMAIRLGEGMLKLYLPELRRYLDKIKAPQPPTALLVNIIRVAIVAIGLLILLNIWKAPDASGILILAAGLVIVGLALRDVRIHLPYTVRIIFKLLLILLVITGLIEVIRRGYLLFSQQADPTSGTIIFLLEIGVLIWLVLALRGSKYRRVRPSFKLVFFSLLGVALVCAFAGIQPLSSYKDAALKYVKNIQVELPAPTTSSWADAIRLAEPSVVVIETKDTQGSGIVIDSSGYILTNNHVVERTKSVTVILLGERKYEGEVVAIDETADLALIRITVSLSGLQAAALGDSDALKIGEEVVAIGYPLGLKDSPTISKGIVSAIREDSDTGVTYIQTDAAVNPGSSGSPLINLKGQVVGIVTAKVAHEAVEGVGFAIAIDNAKLFIIKTKEIQQAERQIEEAEKEIEMLEREVLTLVNSERSLRKIAALSWDNELHRIAREHAGEMARRSELFHSPIDKPYAENCWGGSGYWSASTIVNTWMGSDKHRTWLLCPNLKHIGVGIAVSDKGMYASWTFWRSETTYSDWWYQYGSSPPNW